MSFAETLQASTYLVTGNQTFLNLWQVAADKKNTLGEVWFSYSLGDG